MPLLSNKDKLLYFVDAMAIICCLALALWLRTRFSRSLIKAKLNLLRSILTEVRPDKPLEENLKHLLTVLRRWVITPYYAFYVHDRTSNHLTLRAVTHPVQDFAQVGPAYSGLALSTKEVYLPPLSLPATDMPLKADLVRQGEVPLLALPLPSRAGMIIVGPIKHIPKADLGNLTAFLGDIDPVVTDILTAEAEHKQAQVALMAQRAIQTIAVLAYDISGMWDLALRASSVTSASLGGFYAEREIQIGKETYQLLAAFGNAREVQSALRNDPSTLSRLFDLIKDRANYTLVQGDSAYYALPTYLVPLLHDALDLIRFSDRGMLVVFYDGDPAQDQLREKNLGQLITVANELVEITREQAQRQQYSSSYVNILKKLANMVDDLSPFTVGYSELSTRLALATGQEMGLSDDILYDLAIAAQLANIGVLGLNLDLLFKKGKYSELEYETMKLHAEIGSAMVQISTGNQRAASYILHHHERVDGLGYPSGLQGEDIPVGALILGLVQTFLAKINKRAGRSPLPFDQAINTLQNLTGSQLDPQVVKSFLTWLTKKQTSEEIMGWSLGRCFEMCCVPQPICQRCPVYPRSDINCWKVEGNLCQEHGRSCDSCFVSKEFMSRTFQNLIKK